MSTPTYVDLPGRLEASIGFSVMEIWSVAFALVAHWHKITVETVTDHPGAFDRDTYLSSRYDYSVEEVDRLLDWLVQDAADLRATLRKRHKPKEIGRFDVLPLASRPLVQVGERVFAPNFPLVIDKMINGLHHLHLDQRLFPDASDGDRYLRYMGPC